MSEAEREWAASALRRLLSRVMLGMAGQYEEWAQELRTGMKRC
jgi:hypothetical protein